MNYLDLLDTQANKSLIASQIDLFENKNNIRLPKIYRRFISTFDISKIGKSTLLSFLSEKSNSLLQFYWAINLIDENISIENWFRLDEMVSNMNKVYEPDELSIMNDYITFAESFDQGYLLLGIAEWNSDQIFIEYSHSQPRIKLLCNDVIEFMYSFQIEPIETYLPKGKTVNDLYKNWGEDFWRVRED